MLLMALKYRLCCSIKTVSKEKVENVVSAPKKPVISIAFWWGAKVCSKKSTKNPMIKLPITLTVRVPYGNVLPASFCTHVAIVKRLIAPKNPPTPTDNNICQFTSYSSNITMS